MKRAITAKRQVWIAASYKAVIGFLITEINGL